MSTHSPSPISQPNIDLNALPEVMRPSLANAWQDFCAKAQFALPDDPEWLAALVKVWGCSDFVAKACARFPEMVAELIDSGDLQRRYAAEDFHKALKVRLIDVTDDARLAVVLRQFRRREMVRLAWRDIAGWADLNETLSELSHLARACVGVTLDHLYPWQVAESGQPIGRDSGEPQRMVVIGMGKLGADELNYSSDIDLIFAYPEAGETDGGRFPISNGEFFTKLGRRLITALNQQTGDGFVFRVDMRLRPFGETGPLAASFEAMEEYYQTHGREWERYAMIKAAVIAGEQEAGEELMEMLRPFVYRRYIDYGAFESLREMKAMIAAEYKRKGMDDNIKLGPGGIREIEFIGQAYQLVRGGRVPELQIRPIQQVLSLLVKHNYLPDFAVTRLCEAYIFLRLAENHLQAINDQQTHRLPTNQLDRTRLAWSMGFAQWDEFEVQLRRHMARVHERFEQVFLAPQTDASVLSDDSFAALWRGLLGQEEAYTFLRQEGFSEPERVMTMLKDLSDGAMRQGLSSKGRERLDSLMPMLLAAVAGCGKPDSVLERLIRLVATILRRSAYIALLVETPLALSQLVKLCDASSWIAEHLRRYPVVLDELLDPRSLYMPIKPEELSETLRLILARAGDDLEQQMELMRQFKQASTLRVAAADVSGVYPLKKVSDYLTKLAELEVQAALDLAYQHLVKIHGRPVCMRDGKRYEPGFIIIAYGKMGGIELGYGSDLDLVFVHGNYDSGGETDGAKPYDNVRFFTRLGQRIIHVMTTHTPAGVLYEVDSRLRPDGNKGMLVTSMRGFANYQEKDAWTWEHQALVRARVVAGSPTLAKRFKVVRKRALCRERDPAQLQREVREMRQRMRDNLIRGGADSFDLKQGEGGIADIEFIVQYAVLRWARDYPDLLVWTDNVRQIETLAAEGLIGEVDARWLTQAYLTYREAAHHMTLHGESAIVAATEFADYRCEVNRIWAAFMEGEPL